MRYWSEGGAGGSGEPGDGGGTPPAVATPEATPAPEVAEPSAEDAQAAADRARDEYIANVAASAATRAVQEWASRQPAPSAPAAQPPTAGQGQVAELRAEGAAIQAEDVRLRAAIARDGLTAQNLWDQGELTRRESRFAAQVNLVGLQQSERRSAVDARAPKDDEARTKAWKEYAATHSNVDTEILRDAFDTKWAREHPPKAPGSTPTPPATPPGRLAVNVSGASEVSAAAARARTMTREAANQHRASLRAAGKDAEAATFDRTIRNGGVLIKG